MSIRDVVSSNKGLQDVLVIDAHAHIGKWQSFFIPSPSPELMIAEMDRHGIDLCCVSSLLAIAVDTEMGNNEVSDVVRRFPQRFLGYVTLNPNCSADDNRRELEKRLAESSNFIGIKLHPMWHGCALDDDLYRPLWELAAEHCPLVVGHSWQGDEEPQGYNTPELFASMAERYPEVTIIMGHGGGTRKGHLEAGKYCTEFDNLFMDICAGEFSGLWIEELLQSAPENKVLFATDMPFLGVGSPIGRIAYAQVKEKTKQKIFAENMLEILTSKTKWEGR